MVFSIFKSRKDRRNNLPFIKYKKKIINHLKLNETTANKNKNKYSSNEVRRLFRCSAVRQYRYLLHIFCAPRITFPSANRPHMNEFYIVKLNCTIEWNTDKEAPMWWPFKTANVPNNEFK